MYNPNNYPFIKNFVNYEDLLHSFSQIKNNIPKIEKINKINGIYWNNKTDLLEKECLEKLYLIVMDDDIYEKVNYITDYFIEESRIKCKFKNYESPESYYNKNKNKIINQLKSKNLNITPFNLNNYMYENYYFCTTFFINICALVYTLTSSNTILDFSSGWGDRLIAACGLNKKYIGIDPNGSNQYAYNQIIKTFNCNAKVYRSGAEYLPIKYLNNEKIDLIFTSPPYFDYEIYNSVAQSNNTFSTSEDWISYFLFLVLNKYLPILEFNGHLGLYIQDLPKKLTVAEPIYFFLNDYFPEMHLEYILLKKSFPLYIYKKTNNVSSKNTKLLAKYYPELDSKVKKMIKYKLAENLEMTSEFVDNILYDKKNTFLKKFYLKLLINNNEKIINIIASPKDLELIHELKLVAEHLNKKLIIYVPDIFEFFINDSVVVKIPKDQNIYKYMSNKIKTHFKYSSFKNIKILEEILHETLGYFYIDNTGSYKIEHTYSSDLMKSALQNIFANSNLSEKKNNYNYIKFM